MPNEYRWTTENTIGMLAEIEMGQVEKEIVSPELLETPVVEWKTVDPTTGQTTCKGLSWGPTEATNEALDLGDEGDQIILTHKKIADVIS